MRGEFGGVVHAQQIDFEDAEVGFFGIAHVLWTVGRCGRGLVCCGGGLPDAVVAGDAGVGNDDVEGACGGVREGVFEEGELGGPGGHVAVGGGAVFSEGKRSLVTD